MTTVTLNNGTAETNRFAYFVSLVLALGGLLFGYNATVMAGTILYIKAEYGLSPVLEESVIAAVVVGALIGAAVGGPMADRFGRRSALIFTAAVFVISALASAVAPNIAALIGARTLAGVGVGLVSVVGSLYLSEVAPDHVRGRMVGVFMTAKSVGTICGYLVEVALGADGNWRWMLGFPIVIAVPFAIGVWTLPETPRWWISKNNFDPARIALRRVRERADVDQELDHIQRSIASRKGSWAALLAADVRPILLIGVGLGILQRVTGITIAFLYAPTIFEFAGVRSVSMDILAGLGVGAAFMVGQVCSLMLVDHVGRRPLMLLGYGGMVCALCLLGLAFAMGSDSLLGPWLAVGAVIMLASTWAAGPGSVTFLLIAELYPQHVRGPGMSAATVAIWLSFLIMTFTFLTTMEALGASVTFWAYAVMAVLAMGVVYRFVPETKGKTLEEITAGRGRRY